MLRRHLIALAARTPLLPGIAGRAFLDIDSLLRPVYGHQKQGASYGHAKIAGRALLRKGLSPLVTTLSTANSAPVIAEMRLRAGKTGSGRGAASQLRSAISTTRACGATGKIMVRGDSAFGNKAVIGAAVAAGIEFSLVMTRNPRITRAIDSIAEQEWTPVHYPGAVTDPDTGELISDAEVAEVAYTSFSGRHKVTARLIVRRVKDANYPDALFPVWRYHPFFTNSNLSTVDADVTHRKHAIVETVFADLIDGPLAHIPSGRFGANSAWALCVAITYNLLRAAGTLAGDRHAVARGSTLRRHLVNVPARFARPARKPVLHLPAHWPRQADWTNLWDNVIEAAPLEWTPLTMALGEPGGMSRWDASLCTRRNSGKTRSRCIARPTASAPLRQPTQVEAALGAAATGLLGIIASMHQAVDALEKELAPTFDTHPAAPILRSVPGLGPILAARTLAEIGDDPARFATANGLRAFAGTAPITRTSGRSQYVKARNKRLGDACHWWAFATLTKSAGARAHYDKRRAAGDHHNAALRNLANKLLGRVWWGLQHNEPWDDRGAWPDFYAGQQPAALDV